MELLHKKEKKNVNNEKSLQIRTTQSELHTAKRMEMEETKKKLDCFFLESNQNQNQNQ